ncbi:MAG: hypothetical protein E6R03_18190 [Hyphomicrobiaceae bacterium]|nr:MAG: hypothetical protein E6R03_18190 [Hyphomicrobiaceae bacterium]
MSAIFGSSSATYGSIVYGSTAGGGGGPSGGVFNRSIGQTLSFVQFVGLNKDIVREVSQTLTFVQAVHSIIPATATNTLTFTQDVTYQKFKVGNASNTFVPTQLATYERSINQLKGHNLTILQAVVLKRNIGVFASSTLNLTQLAQGVVTKPAYNTLVMSQSATYTLSKVARNLFEPQHFVERDLTANRTLMQTFQPYHAVGLNKLSNESVSQTLALAQSVIGVAVKNASNTLALTQTVNLQLVKPASNFFGLGHFADVNGTFNIRRGHKFKITQSVTLEHSSARGVTNVLAFNQKAKATRVRHASASNTLVLHQELVQEHFDRSKTDVLVFSQTAVGNRIINRSVGNQLHLAQSMVLSKTLNRTVNHTLTFNNSFQKNVYIGSKQVAIVTVGPSQTVTINGKQFVLNSVGPSGYVPINGSQYVIVRSAEAVLVKNYVVLEAPGGAIVLPAPEFNDSENWTATTNVKRTMDGSRYIYKKETPANHLSYTFVVDRLKALEMRRFLMMFNTTAMRMINWKGEVWIVVLTNNPFQIIEEGYRSTLYGNRCRFTLDFEGVRIL